MLARSWRRTLETARGTARCQGPGCSPHLAAEPRRGRGSRCDTALAWPRPLARCQGDQVTPGFQRPRRGLTSGAPLRLSGSRQVRCCWRRRRGPVFFSQEPVSTRPAAWSREVRMPGLERPGRPARGGEARAAARAELAGPAAA